MQSIIVVHETAPREREHATAATYKKLKLYSSRINLKIYQQLWLRYYYRIPEYHTLVNNIYCININGKLTYPIDFTCFNVNKDILTN